VLRYEGGERLLGIAFGILPHQLHVIAHHVIGIYGRCSANRTDYFQISLGWNFGIGTTIPEGVVKGSSPEA
jgi:hypothetical protein